MRRVLAIAALLVAAGCAGALPASPAPPAPEAPPYAPPGGLPGDVRIEHELPRGGGPIRFESLPWPSELRRAPSGKIDWRGFPGEDAVLVSSWIAEAEDEAPAFSIAPTIYFHPTGPIARARLPKSPKDTLAPGSPVALIDVDPKSPTRGRRVPLGLRYYDEDLRYVAKGTLALTPPPGHLLRPGTLYAAVVRRDLGDAAGHPLGTAPDLEAMKWTRARADPVEEAARRLHAPALDELERAGFARKDLAAVALFRTQVPHAVFEAMFDVATHLPTALAPRIWRAAWLVDAPGPPPYSAIRGYYCTPSFQGGLDAAPFLSEGGTVELDRAGRPRVVPIPEGSRFRTPECGPLLRARFVLTVPRGPEPPGGWPLMVSSHGTTGDALSFLGEDDFAGWAARQGIAVVSTDQPLHGGRDEIGARPGSREPFRLTVAGIPVALRHPGQGAEVAFYNPLHPAACRDNLRQAAIDSVLLARVVLGTDFAPLLQSLPGRVPPRFDRRKLLLAGHSQGSQSIIAQGAIDPLVRGVLLSGCGGDVRLGIVHRRDLEVRPVLEGLLGLAPGELDAFHPLLTVVQTLLDPVDPQSFARFYREPLAGRTPPSVLHFEGVGDSMTPAETAEALAIALGAPAVSPALRPLERFAPATFERPAPRAGSDSGAIVDGNGVGGKTTLALVQLAPTRGEDGHFVLYYEPGIPELAQRFLRDVVDGVPPRVGPLPPPGPPMLDD